MVIFILRLLVAIVNVIKFLETLIDLIHQQEHYNPEYAKKHNCIIPMIFWKMVYLNSIYLAKKKLSLYLFIVIVKNLLGLKFKTLWN